MFTLGSWALPGVERQRSDQLTDLPDAPASHQVLTVRQLDFGIITWRRTGTGELHIRRTNISSLQRRRQTSNSDRYAGFWGHDVVGQRHLEDHRCILGHEASAQLPHWSKLTGHFHFHSYKAGIRLTGVIYMQRISDVKVSGSARQSFRMFQELCGEETFPNVLLVTGMWDTVTPEIGDARDRELASKDIFFKPVLEKGARMMRHDNTRASGLQIVRNLVDRPPVTLCIQRELGGGVDIMQTSVYKQIREVMSELVAQRQRKLDTLMEEMAEAERDGDEETQEELEEEVQAAKVELQEAQDKVSGLAREYQAELRRIEEMLRRRKRL